MGVGQLSLPHPNMRQLQWIDPTDPGRLTTKAPGPASCLCGASKWGCWRGSGTPQKGPGPSHTDQLTETLISNGGLTV